MMGQHRRDARIVGRLRQKSWLVLSRSGGAGGLPGDHGGRSPLDPEPCRP